MVRPRLLGFRFGAGGGGGNMNAGEFGADIDLGLTPCIDGSTPVGWARAIPPGGGTFRDKFFAFRAFLLGDIDCGEELPVHVGGTIVSCSVELLPIVFDEKSDKGSIAVIGEFVSEPVSVSALEDSVVDIVVVGEELLDDEAEVDVLSLLCSCSYDSGPAELLVMTGNVVVLVWGKL